MELEGGDAFRIGAYRRAATRIRETSSSVAQLALDGRAKELQGIGKTIEQKIVEVVDDGEIHALTKRKAEVPGRGRELHAPARASARRPRAGSGRSSGSRRVAGLRAAAEARAAARPRRARRRSPRRRSSPRSRKPAGGRGRRGARCSATALPRLRAVAEALAGASRRRSQVSIAGSARRYPRDRARPRPDRDRHRPAGADRRLLRAAVGRRGRGAGRDEGDVVGQDGLRFDLRVVPPESYGNLLQHFTGSKDHNVALREAAVRRGLSVSEYGDHRGRDRRGRTPSRPRRRSTRSSATPGSRPSCARTAASSRRPARGELPELVELADLRGDLHTHTTWSDGKDSLEAMVAAAIAARLRLLRDLRPLPPPARRPARSSRREAIDALERAASPIRLLQGDRGQHPRRRRARRRRRGARDARLGGRLGAQSASTRTRPTACSRRWRTPTSTASAT